MPGFFHCWSNWLEQLKRMPCSPSTSSTVVKRFQASLLYTGTHSPGHESSLIIINIINRSQSVGINPHLDRYSGTGLTNYSSIPPKFAYYSAKIYLRLRFTSTSCRSQTRRITLTLALSSIYALSLRVMKITGMCSKVKGHMRMHSN